MSTYALSQNDIDATAIWDHIYNGNGKTASEC